MACYCHKAWTQAKRGVWRRGCLDPSGFDAGFVSRLKHGDGTYELTWVSKVGGRHEILPPETLPSYAVANKRAEMMLKEILRRAGCGERALGGCGCRKRR